jgi:hypothetical protein
MPVYCKRFIAVLLVLMLPLGGCIKGVYRDMSYPLEPPVIAERGEDLSFYATVLPELLVDYDQPAAVGACLRELQNEDTFGRLLDYGSCLADQTVPATEADPRGAAMRACFDRLPFLNARTEWRVSPSCAAPWEDQVRLATRLASAGEIGYASLLSRSGGRETRAFRPQALDGYQKAFATAVRLLEKDPAPAGQNTPRVTQPVLALSGGAANGSFTAGYLHALLSMREVVLDELRKSGPAGQAAAARVDARTRFGGAASTSVGTLVGLPLDLYFSDVEGAKLAALEPHLRECLASPSGPLGERAVQRCALRFLRHEFTERSEHHLLCHEPGTVLPLFSVFGQRTNLLRFDPLANDILRPFLGRFSTVMLDNDFQRIAVAVDLEQGLLMGLDERACRLEGMPREACLMSAVLSSIDEPIFTPGEKRVYSGLGVEGEGGLWLDGGLRSGTPVVRALDMSHPGQKVLVINTHRAEGVPHGPYKDAGEVFFGTLDALIPQTRQWEMAYAQLARERRRLDTCIVLERVQPGVKVPVGSDPLACQAARVPGVSPGLLLTGDVFSVFVPDDISPPELYAGGYTFDPQTTRGLFAWGQKTFLESRKSVLGWLRWEVLLDPARELPGFDVTRYHERLRQMEQEAQAVISALEEERKRPDYAERYKAHAKERRAAMNRELRACE